MSAPHLSYVFTINKLTQHGYSALKYLIETMGNDIVVIWNDRAGSLSLGFNTLPTALEFIQKMNNIKIQKIEDQK